jgi:hypothetical protein
MPAILYGTFMRVAAGSASVTRLPNGGEIEDAASLLKADNPGG